MELQCYDWDSAFKLKSHDKLGSCYITLRELQDCRTGQHTYTAPLKGVDGCTGQLRFTVTWLATGSVSATPQDPRLLGADSNGRFATSDPQHDWGEKAANFVNGEIIPDDAKLLGGMGVQVGGRRVSPIHTPSPQGMASLRTPIATVHKSPHRFACARLRHDDAGA